MKRAILTTCAVMSLMTASAQKQMSSRDSLSHAIGLEMSKMITTFDSGAIDVSVVAKSLCDSYEDKKAILTEEEIKQCFERYFDRKKSLDRDKADQNLVESEKFLAEMELVDGVAKAESGLLYKIVDKGNDRMPQEGDELVVHYSLTKPDGTVLESSYERGEPFRYKNVEGEIIEGFFEGVRLIGEGGRIELYIHPSLGYGEKTHGSGEIPGNQALIFDIKLLEVMSPVEELE